MVTDLAYYKSKFEAGISFSNEKRFDESKEEFEKLLDTEQIPVGKPLSNINRRLGMVYLALGEKDELKSKNALYEKDRACFHQKASISYKNAKEQFIEAIRKNNEAKKQNVGNSFQELSDVEKDTPENLLAWAYHDLGYIFLKEKYFLEAEENFKCAIKIAENISNDKTRQIENGTKGPLSWFLNDLGHLYYEWGKYDEAVEQYNKVIEDDQENGYAQVYTGLALYQKGDLERSENYFEMALRIFDERIKKEQEEASAWINLKESLKLFDDMTNKKKERIKAISNFEEALRTLKDRIVGEKDKINELSKIEKHLEKLKESIYKEIGITEPLDNLKNDLNAFEKEFPFTTENLKLEKASILTNIGRIETDNENYINAEIKYDESNKIYTELMPYLEKATKLSMGKYKEKENISSLHNNWGILYYKQDRIDEAIKEFNITKRYSESARAYNNLGNSYFKKGDKIKATENYLIALEINPALKETKENLKLLKEEKDNPANWWDWWFNSRSKGKFIAGIILILMFFLTIAAAFIPLNSLINWDLNSSEERTVVTTIPLIAINPQIISGMNESATIIATTKTNTVTNNTEKTTTEETTGTYPTKTETTKTTSNRMDISAETKLLFAALILFALIHPQIKGFSAGAVKFDLEPIAVSKGAATPQCAS